MFESLGLETLTPRQAAVIFGLALGAVFGALAERSGFCFRRAVVAGPDRRRAAGLWLVALAAAVLGTQAAVSAGLIGFADHRHLAPGLPVAALLLGGALFGTGMVLTRGCVSRLAVLSGGGNLRALAVLVIFAITAHATLKGVLSPLRTALGGVTVELGSVTLPGSPWAWAVALAGLALVVAWRGALRPGQAALGVAIGLLAPLGWLCTGFILHDDFDPIAMESLSFTLPAAETLFWSIASTAVPAGFGTGLVGGVLAGALVSTLAARRFRWQSFESPRQTGRYAAGAVLMGVGGVLAGGCTLGAGLSGVPTLGLAPVLALAAMAIGARVADAALNAGVRGSAGSTTTRAIRPAE